MLFLLFVLTNFQPWQWLLGLCLILLLVGASLSRLSE